MQVFKVAHDVILFTKFLQQLLQGHVFVSPKLLISERVVIYSVYNNRKKKTFLRRLRDKN